MGVGGAKAPTPFFVHGWTDLSGFPPEFQRKRSFSLKPFSLLGAEIFLGKKKRLSSQKDLDRRKEDSAET